MTTYTTNRVRFASGDDILVGDLYRPARTSESFNGAVVVVTGSWTTSKKQQADFYARRLAAAGIGSLTFDFRGFRQSQGQPYDWENPERKITDINAAVTHLTGHGDAGPGRIGATGVCTSSGYQVASAVTDPWIRSLVMIAPWPHNPELVAPYYGSPKGVAERITASRRIRIAYGTDGVQGFIPAAPTTNPAAAIFGPYDYYLGPERGAIPEWDAQLVVVSWEPWLTFGAISSASRIDIPVQSIHSRAAAIPDGAELSHKRLRGPSELTWIGSGQPDFYDQPAQVAVNLERVVSHFRNTLRGTCVTNDGDEIVTTLTKLFWATDHHDWEGLRRVFVSQVLLGYTATLGGKPRIYAPGEAVDGWHPVFEILDAHQHLIANHMMEIADEEATTTTSFIIIRQFQDET